MKKIISFSLYGDKPMYTIGAVRNAELAPTVYPGWICRFYVNDTVPAEIITRLQELGSEIVFKNEVSNHKSMFWRFDALNDPEVEFVIVRDCDSRLNRREAAAVDEWLKSGADFHIMRDHPKHASEFMGGLWGCRCSAATKIDWNKTLDCRNCYGSDQYLLIDLFYRNVYKSAVIHASFWAYEPWAKQFPTERFDDEYVGEAFDEHERFDTTERAVLHKKIKLVSKIKLSVRHFLICHGFSVSFMAEWYKKFTGMDL